MLNKLSFGGPAATPLPSKALPLPTPQPARVLAAEEPVSLDATLAPLVNSRLEDDLAASFSDPILPLAKQDPAPIANFQSD